MLRDILKNKIKYIEKKTDLLKNALVNVEKRKGLFEKGLKKIAKMQNLSQNEFNQIAVMHGLSRDELEQIAKIRRIKNYEDMKKEDLIISFLKSKESIAELFNDNRYDNEISDIRRIPSRLRDILPKKDRKEIKDKLYEIEHQRNISEEEQERNDEYLRKLVRILNNKEKYRPGNRDDFDYDGITDIPILFGQTSEEDYYKPIFVKSSHKGNYKHYESNGDIEKTSVYQYLNKSRPYLYVLINDHRVVRRVWKIQINMDINFISSRDTGETRIYYVWSDNVSIMQGENTNAIIRGIFRSFLQNYQQELKMIKGSDFVFKSVDLLDYKLHRVRLKIGGSYMKSPEWILHKGATIKPKNENDDECLWWSIFALNYSEITKKEFENIFKKDTHEDKDFSSHKRDWENFEQNNKLITINVSFSSKDGEEITLLYKSKYNSVRENKVLLLMINDDNDDDDDDDDDDDEKYYYFAVKAS